MRSVLTALAILFSAAIWGQDTTQHSSLCQEYKTGTFYVINGADTCFIKRTETRQTEKCGQDGETYEFIVIWLKDKKYLLRDKHYNPSTKPDIMRNDVIMTVMEIHEDYHIVHVKGQGRKKQLLKVYCLPQEEDGL